MVSHPENGSDSPIGSDQDRGCDSPSLHEMDHKCPCVLALELLM